MVRRSDCLWDIKLLQRIYRDVVADLYGRAGPGRGSKTGKTHSTLFPCAWLTAHAGLLAL